MSNSAFDELDEKNFFDRVNAQFVEKAPNFNQSLNIAVIGKVSSGKSSLINALLKLSPEDKKAEVGSISGVTKSLTILKLDERVYLIDSPGLDDIRTENSEVTRQFLKHIDIGIFVVTGSSDVTQKKNFDDLRQNCDSVFVVLNKIDEWDKHRPIALDNVVNQWKNTLQIDHIYRTCTNGYDPDMLSPEMDIRGVDELLTDIEKFLEKKGKDILLARHMADKQTYAVRCIASALSAVAVTAFLPGSSLYITTTQSVAITYLYYLYTGEVLAPQTAIAILPTFLAETAGQNLFLFVKSFLPPTGIIDVAAAGVAVTITLSLLATVNYILSSGNKLEQEELLRSKFRTYRQQSKSLFKEIAMTDIRDLSLISPLVAKFLIGSKG